MWPFLVAGGLSALGSILKYAAAGSAAGAARSTAAQNAQSYEDAATDALHRAALTQIRAQAKGDAVIAEQRIEESSGGLDVNVGSNADLATQTQQWTDLDKEIIKNEAMREAYGLRTKEQMVRQESEYAYSAAKYEQLGALIGGIGSIAGIARKKAVDNA